MSQRSLMMVDATPRPSSLAHRTLVTTVWRLASQSARAASRCEILPPRRSLLMQATPFLMSDRERVLTRPLSHLLETSTYDHENWAGILLGSRPSISRI